MELVKNDCQLFWNNIEFIAAEKTLIYFVKRLNLLNNFKGADIVEVNPDKDICGITVKLGAKLLSEMI